MTPHEPPQDDLRRLLHDAVDDIEPGHGLDSIRARTKESSMSRPWIWGVGGAVVATAATVTAIAFAGNLGNDPAEQGGPATTPSSSEPAPSESEPSETPEASVDSSPSPPATSTAVAAVYWVGDTPQGPRLYREFHRVSGDSVLDSAVAVAVGAEQNGPMDPDYRTVWPDGTSVAAATDGDVIKIDLTGDVRQRPGGMSAAEASMSVEQLIYTAQAAVQERSPVRFTIDGQITNTVLGVPTSEELAQGDPNSTLALVSITSPQEGAEVSGSFQAEGVANSFEANVPWEIRRGEEVVKSGFSTAAGWMDRLYPWQTPVDVSDLAPGEYTFVASTDDPSGGAEGAGPHVDTRTITVR